MTDDSRNDAPSAASELPEPPAAEGGGPRVKVVDRRWWAKDESDSASADEEVVRKPTYVEELERQLAEKNQLLQTYIAQHKEAVGEFEDVKVRIRRDVLKDIERSRRAILSDLLDIVDNLDRAVSAARESGSLDALLQGLDLIQRQFLGRLEGFDVRRLDALGERFDPVRHDAVTAVPVADAAQHDAIVGVIRPGYLIGEEVLRPALVAVGKFTNE